MSWKSPFHTPSRVCRELETARLGIALDQGVEAGLVDGYFATVKPLDLARIHIDADHMVARISKTGTGDEAHIAGAENRNAHLSF